MSRFSLLFFLCVLSSAIAAQPGKKPAPKKESSQQAQINKMMEEAMLKEGMSKEEIAEAMKMMNQGTKLKEEMKNNGLKLGGPAAPVKIPAKQNQLLSKIPTLGSAQQYSTYITGLLNEAKKHINPLIIAAADKLINAHLSNDIDLNNLSILLLLKQQVATAVYISLRVAEAKPNQLLAQHNLAFMLHQAGYPQKAIPLLQYQVRQHNVPSISNNLAQCYLSLGDKENAKVFFRACLAKNDMMSEANCGMGLILTEEGKTAEAAIYIAKSLKAGYSITADDLAKKNKVKFKFSEIREKVPEYFNPQKFKPIPAATVMEEVNNTITLREDFDNFVNEQFNKNQEVLQEYIKHTDTSDVSVIVKLNAGSVSNAPFARKAQWMMKALNEEITFFMTTISKEKYKENETVFAKQLETSLANMYKDTRYENMYEECKKKVEFLNIYLKNSSANYDNFQRATLHKYYDWTNQSLYWHSFLENGIAYKSYYNSEILGLFQKLQFYSALQPLYPTPSWIATYCKDYQVQLQKIKWEKDSADAAACAVNVKVKLGPASWKTSCKGIEIEGGEVAVFGFEKDNQTGEFQLSFGLGGEIDALVLGLGVKGQMYFRFDKDFSPIDMGMKFEAGGEAVLGPYTIEDKMSAAMGISGIHVNAINNGKEISIFEMDPVKD